MRVMKTVALALLLCAAGCSGIRTLDTTTVKTFSLDELPQIASGGVDGAAKGPGPMIVHIKAGEKVPLHLAIDVPFAKLEAGENAIVFTRDVYLYVTPDTAMLGFDGRTFARIGDWKALKKLAGVENGTLSVGFGAGKSDGPRIDVKLGLK
ncbi:MAG: hypothetical protein M0R80_17900 [Proteobacteria bacterium]|nr:hypothetical protein [Pseudomonadota bacterium]